MPSKGFQLYTYVASPGTEVKYSAPGITLTRSEPHKFFNDHLEVHKKHIHSGPFNFVGRFRFDIIQDEKTIFAQWCDVNTLTGNIERSSTLREMEDQVSHVAKDVIVTYGMYDASKVTAAGLPRSNQLWITVHPNRSKWMGDMIPSGSGNEPFSRLVLPSAHDVGMNNMQNVDAIWLKSARPFINVLKQIDSVSRTISSKTNDDVLISHGPNIIRGLAFTQKDSLPHMLAIGARYFEFRPAHLLNVVRANAPILDRLYFHHGPVPGMSFEQFLHELVHFLLANASEIVVIHLRWDNVPEACEKPVSAEIARYLAEALKPADGALAVGSLDDMKTMTVDGLREAKKRLICFADAKQCNSWSAGANATLDGKSIVEAMDRMTPDRQEGKDLTLLQTQATATQMPDIVAFSVMTANVSNSCLLATKALCDHKVLLWIRDKALDKLGKKEQLMVIMGDFIDGATVETALELCRKRLEKD